MALMCVLLCIDGQSQTGDTINTINFPLSYDVLSLYDFAAVRVESNKTEVPPADIVERNFEPVKKIFQKDSLYFNDTIQNAWFKFTIRNSLATDTAVALAFPMGVSKAVLYKSEGGKLILAGKTGFTIAVVARTVSYDHARIDIVLKARSQTKYFIQIISFGVGWKWMPKKMPVLENIRYAEIKAFDREKRRE